MLSMQRHDVWCIWCILKGLAVESKGLHLEARHVVYCSVFVLLQ